MKNWISFPKIEGITSRQAHADFPEGSFEREMGKEGFFGPATHLYHKHPPTGWTEFSGPLQPRAFDTNSWTDWGNSPWDAKTLLQNAQCKIRFWQLDSAMDHLVRNSDGDELLFVHNGAGELYCDFGRLTYRDGDYVVLPRGTMWRLAPSEPTELMLIEATDSSYKLPDKGLVGPHAIFDPAMLDTPVMDDAFRAQQTETPWTVVVKRRNQLSRISYPFNPLDALGWKGDLVTVRINWRDIRPLMSHRYHLPPSAHTTFVADGFVVCTFCPRPIESDPGALKVPFFHNNDDYDEFIFYHRGEFFSRDNIHPGMTTFHPCGFTHGPHPKAFAKGQTHARKETDEVAVMVDARHALDVAPEADAIEWKNYVNSWKAS
ncbi:homogentisate 1,2-dioxygenase [Govanella unica]|uniref:Homogentisate 1,2-dioxygenase n=1 Tax=Govanella unica TaxID=2975056 RepID=A0A9X3TWS9_9PROT|nr:homogentisate 1,2-dioxygenase [Govania unica]MDA5193430.1 homogentisate 1,2-dioxygenase [Govania unica]